MDWQQLAERCEQAEGPSYELDRDIMWCMMPDSVNKQRMQDGIIGAPYPDKYTASIDAALTLVPDGWFTALAMEDRHSHSWRWELRGGYGNQFAARAKTPALALCAAALKARGE